MRIEFLGTGGADTTPRPGCTCAVCVEARKRGVPYSRGGPAIFVHGPDVLVDTPEEIKDQLNRAWIENINACFYSHWHPDHTMGRRVWEALNIDIMASPPSREATDIYLPRQVGIDFRKWLGHWEHFAFMQEQGWVRVIELADGECVEINGVRITPFPLAEGYVYAFLFEDGRRRVLIAPDELVGWQPPGELAGLDLAVLPMGVVEFDVFTGERILPEDLPILKTEATYEETLAIIEELNAKRTILTHIEEIFGLSFDDLQRLQAQLEGQGRSIKFAYDTLIVDVT